MTSARRFNVNGQRGGRGAAVAARGRRVAPQRGGRRVAPQRGATLIIVLIMLIVITMLGIASIRLSNTSMQVVGNMQARKYVENVALQAVEQVMNTISPFNSPDATFTATAPAGMTVVVSNRNCVYSAPAAGYSAAAALAPEDNNWEFRVRVTDSFTGANVVVWQGTKIRQLNGYCTSPGTYPSPL